MTSEPKPTWSWADVQPSEARMRVVAIRLDEAAFDQLHELARGRGASPADAASELLTSLLADDAAENAAGVA